MSPDRPSSSTPLHGGEDALWSYYLALYAEPDVASRCIRLQDRFGADVNLVLYACWAASHMHKTLAPKDFQPLITATTPWRESVTQAIRSARRALKAEAESLAAAVYQDLRQRLLDAELEAERIEVERLARLSPVPERIDVTGAEVRAKARANINAYLAGIARTPDEDAHTAIDGIAAAAGAVHDR